MAKLELSDLENLQSEQSAVTVLAENNAKIEAAIENSLSRNGSGPNNMQAPLDMNGYRILNLPAPLGPTDPVRYQDLTFIELVEGSLPSVAGQSGRYLSTDGTNLYWTDPADDDTKLVKAQNLNDVPDKNAARFNLGLKSAAVYDVGTSGHTVPLLDTDNTWTGQNILSESSRINNVIGPQSENALGYRGTHPNIRNQDYTFQNTDLGRAIYHTDSNTYTWTLPEHTALYGGNGDIIVLLNFGSANVTIAQPVGGVIRQAGNGATGNRTLAPHGLATLFKAFGNIWYISGSGVT
jgi:hypothetical protein